MSVGTRVFVFPAQSAICVMGWLRLVGSLKLQVSFAKEPYKREYILQKRPIILRSLLIVATPFHIFVFPAKSEICVSVRVFVRVHLHVFM